ncbi:hypothetical protein NDN08_005425 [Rhodosorus marinus]|uniref:Peptidyl-tRNA hydrolase n=1 Tax=Rhodosorus marinus TaxID=101924 RepID=A0AAV8V1J1_9RHOD|nr:hypothetical protein NDN08_005425 [Rhodosorus marinus]
MACFVQQAASWRPYGRSSVARKCRFFASVGSRGSRLAVIGLGNPGNEFRSTRHNIGFDIIEAFAQRHGGNMKMAQKFLAEMCEIKLDRKTVMLVKPMTFMNLSGTSVRKIVDFYKLPHDAILVVADDIYLELGRVRLRAKGSSGGHNGLKHIEKSLGTQIYPRLKVGVGGPDKADLKDYVLGKFKRSEIDAVDDMLWTCVELIDEWVNTADLSKVVNNVTKKN